MKKRDQIKRNSITGKNKQGGVGIIDTESNSYAAKVLKLLGLAEFKT